jgi:hypothetical protein
MRFLLVAIAVFLLWSCKKECDTMYHKDAFPTQEQVWLPQVVPAALRYAKGADTVEYLNTGKREGWAYPETQIKECGDLYFTTFHTYTYSSPSLSQQLTYEYNAQTGARLQITFGGWRFYTPLGDSSDVISIFQPADTTYKNIAFTQLDSLVVGSTTYKPVKVLEMFTSSPDAFRLYIAPGKGIVQYDLTDGSQWKLVN